MKVHPSEYFAEKFASNAPWSSCCSQQQEEAMEEEPTAQVQPEPKELHGMEGKSEETPVQTPNVNANGNSAPKELNPFQLKLKQLEEMGFVERERNIAALLKNDGNLLQTVKDLLGA